MTNKTERFPCPYCKHSWNYPGEMFREETEPIPYTKNTYYRYQVKICDECYRNLKIKDKINFYLYIIFIISSLIGGGIQIFDKSPYSPIQILLVKISYILVTLSILLYIFIKTWWKSYGPCHPDVDIAKAEKYHALLKKEIKP